MSMAVLDIKRAHSHARATRRLFIELPPEDARSSEPDACGELVMSMYGTRDAAYNWEQEYSQYMLKLGFEKGTASPCHFYRARDDLRVLVHGDDFATVGAEADVEEWIETMKDRFPCVVKVIGPGEHQDKELKIIGRWVRITKDGVELEVDAKYQAQAIQNYGLGEARAAATPAAKEDDMDAPGRRALLERRLLIENKGMTAKDESWTAASRGEPIGDEERSKFQSTAALLNFIAPDRADILYSTKEILRAVSQPGDKDVGRMKRLLRFLKGRPRLVTRMPYGEAPEELVTCVDADFAGCKATRKSTCG